MMPLRRPDEAARNRWTDLDQTRQARDNLEARRTELANDELLRSKDFKPAWREGRWADSIAEAQGGLCAWCTREPRRGGHTAGIDHVRPKSLVHRDIGKPGEEHGFRDREKGREPLPKDGLRPGYYWLAYDPDNHVFCCDRCNSAWKGTLWPVRPWHDAASWTEPQQGVDEDELVLDPFSPGFHPADHFRFGENGAIVPSPGDDKAEATIAVLGLDRTSLCRERAELHRDLQLDLMHLRRVLEDATAPGQEELILLLERLRTRCYWTSPHAAYYQAALGHELTRLGIDSECIGIDEACRPRVEAWVEDPTDGA